MLTKLHQSIFDIASNKNSQVLTKAPILPELFAQILSDKRPVVFVADSMESFDDIYNNLKFLCNEHKSILKLPFDDRNIYHATSSDPMIVTERLAAGIKISLKDSPHILLMPPFGLIAKIYGQHYWQKYSQLLIKNALINRNELLLSLELMGYARVNDVLDKGTYAVRGSVIDIFGIFETNPVRIDLFGDEIESIKYFSASTQRSIHEIESIIVGPAKQIIFDDEAIENAHKNLAEIADELNYPTKSLNQKLFDIKNKIYFFGIEKLLPAFYEKPCSYLDLIAHDDPYIIFQNKDTALRDIDVFLQESQDLYQKSILRGELSFPVARHFYSAEEIKKQLDKFNLLNIINENSAGKAIDAEFLGKDTSHLRSEILKESISLSKDEEPHLLKPVIAKIKELHSELHRVIIPCQNLQEQKQIKALFTGLNIERLDKNPFEGDFEHEPVYKKHVHAYALITKNLPSFGSILDFLKLTLIAPSDIFGKKAKKSSQEKHRGYKTSIFDLNADDYVTHVDHGIGRFKGIVRLSLRGVDSDYLLITYQKDEKLYLPIHRINLIKPYQASSQIEVKLDKLGSTQWSLKKQKVKAAVMSMAQELLNLYAKRQLANRPAFLEPDAHFSEFESDFEFETTIDQQKAIDDVIADMQKEQPMDRLICGDVGYGKTEVAMRAAMMAIMSRKTVAILAPTTVLAQQHGITFKKRFEKTGASIEVLSRFQKPAEVKRIIKNLADNKIDIIIGTHRLLSPDVQLANLGLVVVDEEQRFGIKAKEHLKKMRNKVDILSMSATPIPRTMQMGYFGIRDLSVIETPPVDRLSIQTSIVQFDDEVIKEAITREISRGGQVYFVHNKVKNINHMAEYLKNLVPMAKIDVAHGQMPENELEEKMLAFMNHETNVLLCTTIIETGIDVSSANTMLINDADEFGLSQLYQLRGRIGRGKQRAFAYLMVDRNTDKLTDVAKARLEILHKFSDLGSGFRIAQHDLEIRGAGDLLGKSQHGHMAAIGYELYSDLLLDAVKELRGQKLQEEIEAEVILPISTFIPEKYCQDMHERMSFYQRIATAADFEKLDNIFAELTDLYGDPPQEVLAIRTSTILKLKLKEIHALSLKIDFGKTEKEFTISIGLSNKTPIEQNKLLAAMQKNTALKITPQNKVIQTIGVADTSINEAILIASKQAIKSIKNELLQH